MLWRVRGLVDTEIFHQNRNQVLGQVRGQINSQVDLDVCSQLEELLDVGEDILHTGMICDQLSEIID